MSRADPDPMFRELALRLELAGQYLRDDDVRAAGHELDRAAQRLRQRLPDTAAGRRSDDV